MEQTTPIEETTADTPPVYTYHAEKLTGIFTKILQRNVEWRSSLLPGGIQQRSIPC